MFTPIGDQETPDGAPIALANCSACGSTVALRSVEDAARAAWPDETPSRCHSWQAKVSGNLVQGYRCEITVDAAHLRELSRCIAAAARELVKLGASGV
jgi:hypothetical protein